ncbi:MAG TPA: TIGR03435 family protein [Bryobacteraceae bacterium]|nr:TIGR03435 family protein [Bryobacteraceae bacterium]
MKKLLLLGFAIATLHAGALLGQTFTGTWQGAIKAPQAPRGELRTVIKISVNEGDKLAAVFYSIDQGARPLTANAVTASGSNLKLSFVSLNGTYEGRLSADGNTIEGTWSQGQPVPLTLTRATPQTAWTIPDPPPPPVRMANPDPGFEVATIKPSDPDRQGKLFTVRGQDIVTINTTLNDLITEAYSIHSKQIAGAPSWIGSEKYDLTIKPDAPGQPSVAQLKIIMQKLLAERFQLKFHSEKRELAVYAITVAKTGAKLTKSQSDPNGLPGLFFGRGTPGVNFNVRNATIAEVGSTLQGSILDKPVVDQTGLTDKYDFTLKFTPDAGMLFFGPQPSGNDSPDAPPDVFAAFEQQLGLKLGSTRAQAEVLVIDHVEKPSAN